MTTAVLRSAKAGAILTTLALSVGLMPGVAEAAPPRTHKCTSASFGGGPPEWQDVNQRYGVSERLIGPPGPSTDDIADPPGMPGCRTALVGEQWVRTPPLWLTASETERDAFITNFKSARYVIDEGTAQEQTVTAGPEILQSGMVPVEVQVPPRIGGLPFVVPVSPVFHPLSPGTHTTTLYVDMNEKVCSGLALPAPGLSPGATCLEAGEHEYPILDKIDGSGPGHFLTVLTGPRPPTA